MKYRTSWILMEGILCFKDKTGENIPFENGFYFKSLDSWESENYVSRAKPPKIFRLKTGFISKVWIHGNRKIMFQGQNRRKYSV